MGFSQYWKIIDVRNFEELDGIILIDWNNFCQNLAKFEDEGGHISSMVIKITEVCEAIVNSGLKIFVVADGKSDDARSVIKLCRSLNQRKPDWNNCNSSSFDYNAAYEIAKSIFKNCPETRYTYLRARGEADPELRRIAREHISFNHNVFIFSDDASLIVGVADQEETSNLLKLVDVASLRYGLAGVGVWADTISVQSFLNRLNDMCNSEYCTLNLPNIRQTDNIGPQDLPILVTLLDDERKTQNQNSNMLRFLAYFFWDHDHIMERRFDIMMLVCAGVCVKAAKHSADFFINGTNDLDHNLFFHILTRDCLQAARLISSAYGMVPFNQTIRRCLYFLRNGCNNRNCPDRHMTRRQIDDDITITLCVPVTTCPGRCERCAICIYGECSYRESCHRSHSMTRRSQYFNTRILRILRRTNANNFTNVCNQLVDSIGNAPEDEENLLNELLRRYQFVTDNGVDNNNCIFKVYYADENTGGSIKRLSPLTSLYYQLYQISYLSPENHLRISFEHIGYNSSDSFNIWYTKCFKEQDILDDEDDSIPSVKLFTEIVDITTVYDQEHYTAANLFQLIDNGNGLPRNGILLSTPRIPPAPTAITYGLKWFEVNYNEITPKETCHPHQCYEPNSISALSNLKRRAELFDSLVNDGDTSLFSPNLIKLIFGFNINDRFENISNEVLNLWNEFNHQNKIDISDNSVLVMLSTVYSFFTIVLPVNNEDNALSTINCMNLFGVSFDELLPRIIEACLLSPLFAIAAITITRSTVDNMINMTSLQVLNTNISTILSQMGIASSESHYILIQWIDQIAGDVFELTGGDDWESLSWFDMLGISTVLLLLNNHQHIHIYDRFELKVALQLNEDFNNGRLETTISNVINWLYGN